MHYLSFTSLAIAAISLPKIMGAPRPETVGCAGGAGSHGYSYTVTSQSDVPGTSQVGDYSVSGATRSRVRHSYLDHTSHLLHLPDPFEDYLPYI